MTAPARPGETYSLHNRRGDEFRLKPVAEGLFGLTLVHVEAVEPDGAVVEVARTITGRKPPGDWIAIEDGGWRRTRRHDLKEMPKREAALVIATGRYWENVTRRQMAEQAERDAARRRLEIDP